MLLIVFFVKTYCVTNFLLCLHFHFSWSRPLFKGSPWNWYAQQQTPNPNWYQQQHRLWQQWYSASAATPGPGPPWTSPSVQPQSMQPNVPQPGWPLFQSQNSEVRNLSPHLSPGQSPKKDAVPAKLLSVTCPVMTIPTATMTTVVSGDVLSTLVTETNVSLQSVKPDPLSTDNSKTAQGPDKSVLKSCEKKAMKEISVTDDDTDKKQKKLRKSTKRRE